MKDINNIENLFKEGLDGFELTPSPQVWNNVEGALFGAPKPVPFYRSKWMVAAMILLLISIGGWFLFSNHNTNKPVVTEEFARQVPENVSEAKITDNSESHSSNAKHNSNANKNTKVPVIKTENRQTDNLIIAKDEVSSQSFNSNENQLTENSFTEKHTSVGSSSQLTTMPSTSIYMLATLPATGEMKQQNEILTVEQFTKKRSNLHIYTGATAEIGMIYYPATEDQMTWAANAAAGLKAGKFYFETGIGYRYTQERGSYKIDFRTQDSIGYYNKVTSFEINPQNPDKIILNYKKTTVYDSIDHISYTAPLFKYNYLTVPLRIGYRLINRGNLFVALETGVEYSKLIQSYIPEDGFYYEGSKVTRIINETPERVTNNWKYMLSVRVGVKLNKNISIIAQPEFSKYLASVYTSKYSSVKPYMMNLRAGIYFDF